MDRLEGIDDTLLTDGFFVGGAGDLDQDRFRAIVKLGQEHIAGRRLERVKLEFRRVELFQDFPGCVLDYFGHETMLV